MSKERWFRYFERVQAERPELSDEEAAEVARERLYDDACEAADLIRKAELEDGMPRRRRL